MHWGDELPQGREAERQAHSFAAAFLMPRSSILASAPRLATLTEAMAHKRRWRVSLTAYIYRLRALDLLSEWQYRTLNVETSRRGYRTNEPQRVSYERSQVLGKVFDGLRQEGVGRREVAAALHIPVDEVDALVFGLTLSTITGSGEQSKPRRDRVDLRLVGDDVA